MTVGLPPARRVTRFRASAMGFEPMTPGSAAPVSEKIKIMTPLSWHFGPIEQAACPKGVLREMHPRGARATAPEETRRAPRASPRMLPGLLRQAGFIRSPDSDSLRDLVSQASSFPTSWADLSL